MKTHHHVSDFDTPTAVLRRTWSRCGGEVALQTLAPNEGARGIQRSPPPTATLTQQVFSCYSLPRP